MRKRSKSKISALRAREIFDYDPQTGVLRWRISPGRKTQIGTLAGWIDSNGYRIITFDGINYTAHHVAWAHVHGVWPQGDLDHKDTTPDHNWIDNLRPATRSQNIANKRFEPARNTSGFKGVSLNRRSGRYVAQIMKDGVNIYLGTHDDPAVAHAAYVAKARELFGEFANAG